MALTRRFIFFLAVFLIAFIALALHQTNYVSSESLQRIPEHLKNLPQSVGLGDWSKGDDTDRVEYLTRPDFPPGTPKPGGEEYSRLLVIARTKDENIEWMDKHIPDVQKAIYIVDDPDSELKVPENKGHEVMVYLTYIIDHYEELSDVTIFMHAHQFTWHNPDVLDNDAARMVQLLSSPRVAREGFMNIRCQWFPGCPDWMHPGETVVDRFKIEQTALAKAWAELFPFDDAPSTLGTPCCSQFALSRERIHNVPKHQFVHYRDWLLKTPQPDFVSGRIWEYLWQYVFTGNTVHCPNEMACYCDGYGACFESEDTYKKFFDLKNERNTLNGKWLEWQEKADKIKDAEEKGDTELLLTLEKPEEGKNVEYSQRIDEIKKEMHARTELALARGNDPRVRAESVGRVWNEGDGF